MSQPSPVESRHQSFPTQPLDPTIGTVLGNLDVYLEEELIRYRRQRPGKKVLYTNGSRRPGVDKPLDTISVKADRGSTQMPSSDAASMGMQNGIPNPAEIYSSQLPLPDEMTSPDAGPSNGSATVASPFAPAASAETQLQPDDYLESSEALLKNLAQEDLETDNSGELKDRSEDNLLTPLGIGLMLLLLLASATLGYVLINPASISHLSWNRLFGSGTPKAAKNSTQTTPGGSTPVAAGIPTSPNLASQEFEQLTLRSLSTVKPRITVKTNPVARRRPQLPVNNPAPLPSAQAAAGDLSRSLLPEPLQSNTTVTIPALPPGAIPAPKPGSASTSGGATATKPPAGQALVRLSPTEDKYLVVIPYGGDRSLTRAKRLAPNAFVRRLPIGSRIQLSAFPSESEARKKVQQLQKQGISAQLYRRPGV